MKSILWIAKREMGSFFYSPIFYVVTAGFLFINSFMFFPALIFFSAQSMKAAQFQQMGLSLNPNEMIIEPSMANMGLIMLFIIPLLTMRSFAEERKNKTFALLLSSPIHLREIIAGKFLACLGVVTFMIVLSSYSVFCIVLMGQPEIGPIFSGYLGVLLMMGCFIALGVFASSLTDNQIIAATISFSLSLFMWIIGWVAESADSGMGIVLNYISLIAHLEPFMKGIIDTSDVVYYVSFMAFILFITYRVLDSRRWR